MANSAPSAENKAIQFLEKYHAEYVRSNRFKRYMGANQNSIIMVKEELTTKRGVTLNIPLVGALSTSGGPNNGSTSLVGNEKALPNEGFRLTTAVVRDGVVVNVEDENASSFDIMRAGKQGLKDLQMRYLRDDIITSFGSIDGIAYATATEGQKDTWLTNNADRALFGAAIGNAVAADHSASLLNVDTTNDRATKEIISIAKRRAQKAVTANGDGIRPFKFSDDMESYVVFIGCNGFRDLKNDLAQYHADAMTRGKDNPLFRPGHDLLWDDVIIREIPELPVYTGVGNAASDVEPFYLCGTQALAAGWSERTKMPIRKEDDYEFQRGVSFREQRKVEKVLYDQDGSPKDWGMVTGFVSSVADA